MKRGSFDVPAFLVTVDEIGKEGVKLKLMGCKQISKKEILNLRNILVSSLKISN